MKKNKSKQIHHDVDIDIQRMLNIANNFYEAAVLCAETKTQVDAELFSLDGNNEKIMGKALVTKLLAPSKVNISLASELYLKTLCQHHLTMFEKKHDLKDLYKDLPPDVREKIFILVKEYISGGTGISIDEKMFDKQLTLISEDFEKWRYVGVWGNILKTLNDSDFIWLFANALKETTNKLRKETM